MVGRELSIDYVAPARAPVPELAPRYLDGHWIEGQHPNRPGNAHRYITMQEARNCLNRTDTLPNWLWDAILIARGGCACQDPGASPPCNRCTTPVTMEEMQDYVDDPKKVWPSYGTDHFCPNCPTGHWCEKLSFALESDMPRLVEHIESFREPERPQLCQRCGQTNGDCQCAMRKDLPNALIVRGGFDKAGDL